MKVLKLFGEMVDNVWAIWCILIIPVVGIVMIQYLPLLTLGLIGLMVQFQLMSADIVKRGAVFTGNKALYKRRWYCYANVIILLTVTILSYGWFIRWNITGGYLCQDYTDWFHGGDWLPWMLPSLLQHVVSYSCPVP